MTTRRLSLALLSVFAACQCGKSPNLAPANKPPVAFVEVTPDGVVPAGTHVSLDGSKSSDPEGKPLRYRWSQQGGDTVGLSDKTSAAVSFDAPQKRQVLVFQLIVSDGEQDSAPVMARVTVDQNRPPVADAGANQNVNVGTTVVLAGKGTDPDGDAITAYAWKVDSAPAATGKAYELSAPTSANAVFQPLVKGPFVLSLVVTDARGADSTPATIVVNAQNRPPAANAASRQTTPDFAVLTLAATGTDPDGDAVTLDWKVVDAGGKSYLIAPGANGTTEFTPQGKGDYKLQVTPFDGIDHGTPVDVTVVAENLAPIAQAAVSAASLSTGETFTLSAQGSKDPDGPVALGYAWKVTQGSATFLSGQNAATAVVKAGLVKETLAFQLVVTDETGAQSAPANVQAIVDNTTPIALATGPAVLGDGESGTLDGSGSHDAETAAASLSYQWTSSLPTVTFSPSATSVSPGIGIPVGASGSITFTLVVSDGRVASVPATVTVDVVPGQGANLFVDAAASCGASCDGTRAKPFLAISPAAAASAALVKPKAILVATGAYPAASVPSGIAVTGGCDTARWHCGGTGTELRPTGAVDGLTVTAVAAATPATVKALTVYGTDTGEAAVRCAGCTVRLEDIVARPIGSTSGWSYGIVIDTPSGPVDVVRADVLAGVALANTALYVKDASNVTVEGSRFATQAHITQDLGSENHAIDVYGSGQNLLVQRSRIVVDADAGVAVADGIRVQGATYGTFAGNTLWYRGAAAGISLFDYHNNAVYLANGGDLYFVNNTFVGNSAAKVNDASFAAFHFYTLIPMPPPVPPVGATGLDYATNNVIQGFGIAVNTTSLVDPAPAALLKMKASSVFDVGQISCTQGVCSNDAAKMDTGHGAIAAGGTGNDTHDCGLKNPVTGDFHLGGASLCVDTGVADLRLPATDLDGDVRPARNGPDRGAFEVP